MGFYVGRKKPFAKLNGKAPSLAVDASDILRFGKISKLKQFFVSKDDSMIHDDTDIGKANNF